MATSAESQGAPGTVTGLSAIALVSDLRAELGRAKANGQASVPITALESYLDSMEATAATFEASKTQEEARAQLAHDLDIWKTKMPVVFQAIIQSGQAALKAGILINGGAAVSLLAFLGNTIANNKSSPGRDVGVAMLIFVSGVLFAALATALTYLCQFFGANASKAKTAERFNYGAIAMGFASLIAFGAGGWMSFRALPW